MVRFTGFNREAEPGRTFAEFAFDLSSVPGLDASLATLVVGLHSDPDGDDGEFLEFMRDVYRRRAEELAIGRAVESPLPSIEIRDAVVGTIRHAIDTGFDAAYDRFVNAMVAGDQVEPDAIARDMLDSVAEAIGDAVAREDRPSLSYLGTDGPADADGVTCYRFAIDLGPGSDTARRRLDLQLCFSALDRMQTHAARMYVLGWLTRFACERIHGFKLAESLRDDYFIRLQSAMATDFDPIFAEHFAPHTAGTSPAEEPDDVPEALGKRPADGPVEPSGGLSLDDWLALCEARDADQIGATGTAIGDDGPDLFAPPPEEPDQVEPEGPDDVAAKLDALDRAEAITRRHLARLNGSLDRITKERARLILRRDGDEAEAGPVGHLAVR